MTGKHTPGPWKKYCKSIGTDWHIVTTSGGTVIANVFAPQNANAYLVAAAPDLLAALKKLASYNEDIAAGRINYRPHDHIAVARAAIAKARGQE